MFSTTAWNEYRKLHQEWFVADPDKWFRSLFRVERRYNWAWLISMLNVYGGGGMVRGKKQGQAPVNGRAGSWTEFVDIPLGTATWHDIMKAFGDSATIAEAMSALLGSGYRVSFVFNAGNDAIICSVTCRDDKSPNANKTFNAFAGGWADALSVALYKHYVIAGEVWAGDESSVERPVYG